MGKQGKTSLAMGISLVFSAFAHLEQGFLTIMGTEGQQMRRVLLGSGGPTYRFAVEGHSLLIVVGMTGLDPDSQHQLDVTHTQAWQQAAIEGADGRIEVTWPKEPMQQEWLIVTPLPHRVLRVAVTEQGGDQAGQQVG